MLERLRKLLGGSTSGVDEALFRCVNCGAEFSHSYVECPDCGGPYVAPVDDDDE